tara:strand:+ start:65 stop:955 length:891 start_codon:yes stop_codon:yes gene_type:complete
MPNIRSVVKSVTKTVSQRVDGIIADVIPLARRLTGDDGCIAYSLRDIGANGGPVVNVRRNHDDATRDFTAAEVAAGDVLTWAQDGASIVVQAYVTRWYDQGDSTWKRDAIQTNTQRQPQIVLNDVYQSDGILFGDAKWLETTAEPTNTNLNWSQPITNLMLSKVVVQTGFAGVYWGTSNSFGSFFFESPNATFNFTADAQSTTANCLNNGSQLGTGVKKQSTIISDSTSVMRLDGTQVASGTFGTNGISNNIHMGTVTGFLLDGSFNIPEIYFFNSKPSDDFITEIENDQKAYYGI